MPISERTELDLLMSEIKSLAATPHRKRRKYKKKIHKTLLPRTMTPSATDQPEDFAQTRQSINGEVVHAVYGIEDWFIDTMTRRRCLAGMNTTIIGRTWIAPAGFDFHDWIQKTFVRYWFFASNSALVSDSIGETAGITKIKFTREKVEVEVYDEHSAALKRIEQFEKLFQRAENLIEWVYNTRGDSVQVPLNFRKAIRSAYPWIDKTKYPDLESYFDEYIDSDANILILIGSPGTGKTTFIKNLIHRSGGDATVAYDPKVISEDGFFASFVEDNSRFLIMEDADEFLSSREDGNTMMHKFLNVSDGLVSTQGKKIVFSTNLPNINDIDPALIRPGRCFDVLSFRRLSRDEALQVRQDYSTMSGRELEIDLPALNDFSLGEIFAATKSQGFTRRKVGFY